MCLCIHYYLNIAFVCMRAELWESLSNEISCYFIWQLSCSNHTYRFVFLDLFSFHNYKLVMLPLMTMLAMCMFIFALTFGWLVSARWCVRLCALIIINLKFNFTDDDDVFFSSLSLSLTQISRLTEGEIYLKWKTMDTVQAFL